MIDKNDKYYTQKRNFIIIAGIIIFAVATFKLYADKKISKL